MKKIHVIGGGTVSHVRNHLALCAPAYGNTARKLDRLFYAALGGHNDQNATLPAVRLHLTRMANPADTGAAQTNEHVSGMIDGMIADPETRVIIMNAALCDFDGEIAPKYVSDGTYEYTISGKYAERLKTSEGEQTMALIPAEKIISKIRETRKDIFLVAFKTTCGATPDEQYLAALDLLKKNSANLVVANDTKTRHNMIVAPEETRYFEGEREQCLQGLVTMVLSRMNNTFTRSTVVDGQPVPFQTDDRVPDNLRQVVNYLVSRGAYKPFNGATAGHFAVRLDEGRCLTSRRKTDYTQPGGLDLVEVEYDGLDKVIAHGAKPSVGGQSQRIVFAQHPHSDCIVHAHVQLRASPPDIAAIAIDKGQWSRECGSHECGKSVADLLDPRRHLRAVMIENHGPNIVFNRHMPAQSVIDFIERNFDLSEKTGGPVEPRAMEAV